MTEEINKQSHTEADKYMSKRHRSYGPIAAREDFIAGAKRGYELAMEDMIGFVEWIVLNNYTVTDYKSKKVSPTWSIKNNQAPLTTSELLDKYLTDKQ